MKASEIRDLSPEEMRQKAKELKEELFNLRFQHEIGQLENPKTMQAAKRNIARVRTIIREKEQQSRTN